jgi:2-desacetyl-2-hydroxyethyl bacteriochlorophyllide A dehydrogenase
MPKALWFVSPGVIELHDFVCPEPTADEVLLRGLFSAVSHGTERLLLRGEGPEPFDPSLDPPNTPTYPRRYGYAWVGEVCAGAAFPLGTRVFALASHADYHLLPANRVRPLPATLPALRATLAAAMETAVNTVWDAQIGLGDRILVLGAGTVGLLSAYLAQKAGAASVVIVEPSPARRACAADLGVSAVTLEELPAAPSSNQSHSSGAARDAYDVVIEATGEPASLDTAIAHCASEGRIVVTSFYGEKRAPLALGARFHRERLSLISSQVSRLPPQKCARYDHDRRFSVVLQQLADARLDALFDEPVPFVAAPAAYQRLAQAESPPRQLAFAY